MLISIIIPVYNTAKYLRECVSSLLQNDTENCEILLIDDGSTDGISPALCDELADQHPNLISVIHQPNAGLGGARNTGIENARGEYLFFYDSDDMVAAHMLQTLKNQIALHHPDIIAFNLVSFGAKEEKKQSNYFNEMTPFSLKTRPDFLLSLPAFWAKLWKKSLFLSSSLRFPNHVWYEDVHLGTKLMALADSIVAIPDHLYCYRQVEGSIMHSKKVDRNCEIVSAFESVIDWYKQMGLFATYEKELCKLCIDHLYLAASVRVVKCDPRHPLLTAFSNFLKKEFPNYKKNPYLSTLSPLHKLCFFLLEKKQYNLLKLLFTIKK